MRLFGRELVGKTELEHLRRQDSLIRAVLTDINEAKDSFFARLRGIREDSSVINKYYMMAALASIYARVSQRRKELFREVQDIRGFYLSNVLLAQLAEDALAPDIGTGDILEVTSHKQHVKDELIKLQQKFNLDKIVLTIIEDLLAFGEYFLSVDVDQPEQKPGDNGQPPKDWKGRGIIEIRDDVEQDAIIALTKFGEIEHFLVMERGGEGIIERLVLKAPSSYIQFVLNPGRFRIDLKTEVGEHWNELNLPRYIRIGKSVLFDVLNKLKELNLLEQLVPATQLAHLSSGTVIGLKVPPGLPPDKAFDAARVIEGHINKKVSVDQPGGGLSVENVIAAAGRLKVIPVAGDRGDMVKIDLRPEPEKELLDATESTRRVILESIGIPYETIYGGGTEEDKGKLLRRHARYLKRLKSIQQSVVDGMLQVCAIDLTNKGVDWRPGDVEIKFRNRLIEVDALDRLQFMDEVVVMMDRLHSFLTEKITDLPASGKVSGKELARFIKEQLGVTGLPLEVILPDAPRRRLAKPETGEPEEEPKPGPEAPAEKPVGPAPTKVLEPDIEIKAPVAVGPPENPPREPPSPLARSI